MSKRKEFDLFIAGAGPAGTAAALRARELGLDVMLIDMDDVMARVRDYGPRALVHATDQQPKFPAGGDWTQQLAFTTDQLPDLATTYKTLVSEAGVSCRTGQELIGLRHRLDGAYDIACWDHTGHAEQTHVARFVLLAMGQGMPRRLDIPGDLGGLNTQVSHPGAFTGRPICVLGAGHAAMAAVVAISTAKRAAGDVTGVYWSHCGTHLPRIPKHLARPFFEAHVGNGNIHFLPASEPIAVLTDATNNRQLAVRTEQRDMAERPGEGVYLTFPITDVVAFIQEEMPESLLKSLAVPPVNGGAGNRRRPALTAERETGRAGIFMAGSLLCPGFLQTADFAADPATFEERDHPGGIVQALADGVAVAEVVAGRIRGGEKKPPETRPSMPKPETSVCLVHLLPDGSFGESFTVHSSGATTLGRRGCDINFTQDDQLADYHASIVRLTKGYVLRDENSWTGVFRCLPPAEPVLVKPGSLLRLAGQFLLLSEDEGTGFVVSHFDHQGQEKGRYPLADGALIFGRHAPVMLGADPHLSSRHLAVSLGKDGFVVRDLNSKDGSFLRVLGQMDLAGGERFRIGNQSFLFCLAPEDRAPKRAEAEVAPEKRGEPSVTFEGADLTVPVAAGCRILEVAQEHNIWLRAACDSGVCGSDPVRIVSGHEFLSHQTAEERDILHELCDLDSAECRLACRARVYGPVVVEVLEV